MSGLQTSRKLGRSRPIVFLPINVTIVVNKRPV
jgi:hypothetical protein